MSLPLVNADGSLPVAYRLYLPQAWAADEARRKKAGVPEEIGFQTKIEIALDQISAAHAADLPRGPVLMDAGYGPHIDLRTATHHHHAPTIDRRPRRQIASMSLLPR